MSDNNITFTAPSVDIVVGIDRKFDGSTGLRAGVLQNSDGDSYVIDTGHFKFAGFRKSFLDFFAPKIDEMKNSETNRVYRELFDQLSAFAETPAATFSPLPVPTGQINFNADPAPSITDPKDTEITVSINEVATEKFFDESGNQVLAIPKIALEHYCKKFTAENYALPRYLEQVYARASDQGITAADLDIQGVGAQEFKDQIIAHFKKIQIWTFDDIVVDSSTVDLKSVTILLSFYRAVLFTDHSTGICQIEIIDEENNRHIFVMEDGQDLQTPDKNRADFEKLDEIRREILSEL